MGCRWHGETDVNKKTGISGEKAKGRMSGWKNRFMARQVLGADPCLTNKGHEGEV